jgi:ABC-type uncharacterized transport system involved in gliding motility auxiliary subunit
MEARDIRVRSLSLLTTILLLVVLVLTNAVFARSSVRIDVTEEGIYTLSEGSRAILARLEDPAIVRVFWHQVPRKFDHAKRYVEALLQEMQAEAGEERFQVQWVDMEEDEGKSLASELGLEEFVFGATHGAEVRESKGYMSMAIELGNERPAVLNALSAIEDQLEYLIVATIYQRTRRDRPVIGFVTQRPRMNPFAGSMQQGRFADFQETLRKAFGTAARTFVSLEVPVPEDISVLVVASPRAYAPEQVYHFEQFLLRGGRAVLLLDPVDIDNVFGAGANRAEPHLSGMEDWLEHLGVTAERGVVGDFDSTCLFPMGRQAVRYAYWPKVLPKHMSQENPVTRSLAPMPMYWPAAISVDDAVQKEAGRKVTTLATTTPAGYRRGDITGLKTALEEPGGKLLEEVALIVMLEGPTKSFWLGKPVPGAEPEPEPGGEDGEESGSGDGEEPGEDGGAGEGEAASGSPDGAAPDPDAPEDEPKKDEPKEDEPKKDEPKKDEPGEAPSDDGDGEADAEEDDGDEEKGPERLEEGDIRLIVLADAELICDQLGPRFPLSSAINGVTGFSFVASAAEWLSGSDDLLALRARSTNPRNLEKLDREDIKMAKALNLLLVPLLVFLLGITVFIIRRS